MQQNYVKLYNIANNAFFQFFYPDFSAFARVGEKKQKEKNGEKEKNKKRRKNGKKMEKRRKTGKKGEKREKEEKGKGGK